MQFKEWLLFQESIIVNTGREEIALAKSNESSKVVEFSYAYDTYHSSFEIWPFSEQRQGYVNTGNATIIGIIKKTPIFPGNGADRAFIQSLTNSLNSSGYKPLSYKEGDSQWISTFKDAGADDKTLDAMKADQEDKTAVVPKMGEKADAGKKVTPGISVSKASGSWAYFTRVNPGNTDFYIKTIERIMKAATKPLLENNLIDYYRIVRGWDYKNEEYVWSEKGKKDHDDSKGLEEKIVAYMKFLAEHMLKNYPNAKKSVMAYFTQSWNKNIQPKDEKISFDKLKEYIRDVHSESPFLYFFLDTVQSNKDHMYGVLDAAAQSADYNDTISFYKEIENDEYEYMTDEPRLWLSPALKILELSDFFEKHARSKFEKFKREYEEAINKWLGSGTTVRPGELEYLKKLSEYINVRDKERIHDAYAKKQEKDEEDKKELIRQREFNDAEEARNKQMIQRGGFKYMMIGKDSEWRDIPLKYINSYDEVDIGLFAVEEDLVDRESIQYAAHDKASEDAWADAEEKKSETYGQNKEEVDSDIDYEWDEYMDDREFDEGEFDDLNDEEKKQKIKSDYFDDFIGWKIENFKKEEEEESWKYEPEPDESDIRKYEEEFAEKQVYEDGLVIMKWIDDDSDEIEVNLSEKYYEKARSMVRNSLSIGMKKKDKYEEPIIKRSQKVEFNFIDSEKGPSVKAGEV